MSNSTEQREVHLLGDKAMSVMPEWGCGAEGVNFLFLIPTCPCVLFLQKEDITISHGQLNLLHPHKYLLSTAIRTSPSKTHNLNLQKPERSHKRPLQSSHGWHKGHALKTPWRTAVSSVHSLFLDTKF